METFESCRRTAGRVLGRALTRILNSDPREAAEAAWKPGGPSVDELEVLVREIQADFADPVYRAIA